MSDKIYDIIIIGAGPAGLTTAIYAARENLSVLVLEKTICGGWLMYIDLIENYPGFPQGIKGYELSSKLVEQACRFKAEILESSEVKAVVKGDKEITVTSNKGAYKARALIITSGTIARKLNIPGEEEFTGKGISYCAICDGPLFKDKDIMVIGGGNPAVEEALFLTKFAKSVTLVHKRGTLSAAAVLQDELKKNNKIKVMLNHDIISVSGEKIVKSAQIKDILTGKTETLETQGIFIMHAEFKPNTDFLKGVVALDSRGYIETDYQMKTDAPGIFAAGDIRSKNIHQVVISCGEGAIAALFARDYLRKNIHI
ncbi:MAG: thioredoxin-disulfide reductase [Candidatus Omnitrophica bacterium]|nr:thioredoxin-disulfide reductase [Candidatus Omnitrophota bacterium]